MELEGLFIAFQVRRRSFSEDGLRENLDFGNPCLAGACFCSCGFNRQVQDMRLLTEPLLLQRVVIW